MSTLHELQHATAGQIKGSADLLGKASTIRLGRMTLDPAEVAPGDVYWALPGKHHDGAECVEEAVARGAVGIVVDQDVLVPAGRWALQVANTLEALRRWAAWKRRHANGSVIAVAGTVGKTTTRQMIHTVLGSRFRGLMGSGPCDAPDGLLRSLIQLEPSHDYAVFELVDHEASQVARWLELAQPTIAVIPQAFDPPGAAIRAARRAAETVCELFAALPLDGYAVVGENAWVRRMASRCRAPITWVGRGVDCDLAAADVRWNQGLLSFRVADCPFRVAVWGRHHLTSALIAIAIGRIFGMELETIAQALERFDALGIPCEVSEVRGATIIHDARNASPAAMRAALEMLRDCDALGRRIVVLGDMADLGEEALLWHRRLGNEVVTRCGADLLIACGQYADDVVAAARAAGMPQRHALACRTPEETLPYLGQVLLPGDVVLVKGTPSLAMEQLVGALKQYPRRRTA